MTSVHSLSLSLKRFDLSTPSFRLSLSLIIAPVFLFFNPNDSLPRLESPPDVLFPGHEIMAKQATDGCETAHQSTVHLLLNL